MRFEVDESYVLPESDAIRADVSVTSSALAGGATSSTAASSATYALRSRPTWNTSAGAEYFVTPTFSVIGGASTNLSTLPALAPSFTVGNLVQARQQHVTLSFGIGSHGDSGELLVGTQLGYGWGQAIAANPYVVPNQFAAVDTQSYTALFVLAGLDELPRDLVSAPSRR